MPMSPERRERVRNGMEVARTGWRQTVRELFWTIGMLDEGGNPSLIRMAAVYLFIVGGHGRLVDDKALIANDVIILSLAAFATLGLKGMAMFRDWRALRVKSTQERVERIFRREAEPDARRDDERG